MTSMTATRKQRSQRKPLAMMHADAPVATEDTDTERYYCIAPDCGQLLPVPPAETRALLAQQHPGAQLCPLDFLLTLYRHWRLLEAESQAQSPEDAPEPTGAAFLPQPPVANAKQRNLEWITAGEQHPRAYSREDIWRLVKGWQIRHGGVFPLPEDFDSKTGELPAQSTVRKRFKGGWHGMARAGVDAGVFTEEEIRLAFKSLNQAHERSLLHEDKFWNLIKAWVDRNPGKFPRHDQFSNSEGLPSMSSVCRYYQGVTGLLYAGLERGIWTEEQLREAKLRSKQAQLNGFPQLRRGGRRLAKAFGTMG